MINDRKRKMYLRESQGQGFDPGLFFPSNPSTFGEFQQGLRLRQDIQEIFVWMFVREKLSEILKLATYV